MKKELRVEISISETALRNTESIFRHIEQGVNEMNCMLKEQVAPISNVEILFILHSRDTLASAHHTIICRFDIYA